MCLRPKLDNSNNTLALLEALTCTSCHLRCSCIITTLIYINIYSITRDAVQKILTHNINDTKLKGPTQILYFMIRTLYEIVFSSKLQ